LDKIRIDLGKFKPEDYVSFIAKGGIFLDETKQAGYKEAKVKEKIEEIGDFTFYEIVEIINRYTHLPCLAIEHILKNNELSKEDIVKQVNKNVAFLPFIIQSILANAYQYQEKTETVEEEIELAKLYPFKISIEQGKNIHRSL